ncbi:MAG: hypothetical protein E7Z87_08150 [Cyanobacteria bacterium SIG26]|nr:hypothetical protein [Cyanobacteria bacterium SIG26]
MIPDQVPVNNYYGNNLATSFDFNYYIENEDQLLVTHTDLQGIVTYPQYGIDYTITEFGVMGGSSIVFPIEDSKYSVLAWDQETDKKEILSLALNLPFSQEAEYEESGKLNKKNLEISLDYLTRLCQIMRRYLERCVKVQEGDSATPEELMETLNETQINAKNYANQAKQSATNAQECAEFTELKSLYIDGKVAEFENLHEEFSELRDDSIADIANLVDNSLNTINSTGKGYDNLTYRHTTNCLLEAPQRIKYDLTDGTLTVKAGSVVIVPYGTEDLTAITEDDVYVKMQQSSYSEIRYWYIKKADADILFKTFEFKQGLILYKVNDDNSVGDIDDTVTLYDYYQGIIYKDTLEPIYGSEYSVLTKGNCYKKNGADVKFDYYFHIPNTIYYFGTNNMEIDSDNDLSIYNEVFTFDGENYVRLEGYIGYYNQGWSWLHDPQGNIVFDNGEWSGQRIEVLNTGGFSIEDTFINENFKVADMQYAKDIDGNYKFFVWAEVEEDIVTVSSETADTYERPLCIDIIHNRLTCTMNTSSSSEQYTGTANDIRYLTNLNTIEFYSNGVYTSNCLSLPVLTVVANGITLLGSVAKVFNSIGHIGSTIWVDKGVKGLIRNKRNDDGTYNNIEHTTSTLITRTYTSETFNDYPLWVGQDGVIACVPTVTNSIKSGYFGIFEDENIIKDPNNNQVLAFDVGMVSYLSGSIVSFNIKQPFRAADFQDVVKKSGDTMTGDLTIEGNYTPRYYLKNTSLDLDNLTTPSANTVLGGINIVDNDEDYIAYLQSTLANTGLLYTSFGTRRKINGQDVTASLSTSIAEDGTAYGNAPNYTIYTDSSSKIVTTAFLKNVLAGNGYGLMNFTKVYGAGGFKLANGIIVNWGSFEPTSNGQEVTINFKYPFSSAYYHIVYSRNTGTTTTSTAYLPWTRQRATTSAKAYAPSISGYTWVAFGY